MDVAHDRIIHVFLAGQPDFRREMKQALQTEWESFRCVGHAPTLADAPAQLRRFAADVVLVEMEQADLGAPAQSVLRSELVLGVSSLDPSMLQWALLSGLRGVVRRDESTQNHLKAIRKVSEGEIWINRSLASRLIADLTRRQVIVVDNEPDRRRIAALTPRERQTIAALTADVAAPAKVVASRLRISENTLRNHLTSIYAKLDLQNRLDLYAYAIRHRIEIRDEVPRPLNGVHADRVSAFERAWAA